MILLLNPRSVNHGFAKNTRLGCVAGSDLTAGLRDTLRVAPASTESHMTDQKCSVLACTNGVAARKQTAGVASREPGQTAAQDIGEKSRDCWAAQLDVLLRLMSSDPIAFCDFLDGHQIGCGSEVADAVFLLQHRPHLLKCFSHCVIKT
jgi:hypothetical protein